MLGKGLDDTSKFLQQTKSISTWIIGDLFSNDIEATRYQFLSFCFKKISNNLRLLCRYLKNIILDGFPKMERSDFELKFQKIPTLSYKYELSKLNEIIEVE